MDWYESMKNSLSGTMQSVASPVQAVAPAVTTSQGSSSWFGTKPETPGYTSTGGRRHTKVSKRKTKKTRKH